jgi:hypothetical protein
MKLQAALVSSSPLHVVRRPALRQTCRESPGWVPLTWTRQIRGCAWWIAGRGPATINRRLRGPLENPAIASYRFRALKVSLGWKHHGIVTKNSNP